MVHSYAEDGCYVNLMVYSSKGTIYILFVHINYAHKILLQAAECIQLCHLLFSLSNMFDVMVSASFYVLFY